LPTETSGSQKSLPLPEQMLLTDKAGLNRERFL
jgi:hypothetical protein